MASVQAKLTAIRACCRRPGGMKLFSFVCLVKYKSGRQYCTWYALLLGESSLRNTPVLVLYIAAFIGVKAPAYSTSGHYWLSWWPEVSMRTDRTIHDLRPSDDSRSHDTIKMHPFRKRSIYRDVIVVLSAHDSRDSRGPFTNTRSKLLARSCYSINALIFYRQEMQCVISPLQSRK